MKIRLYQVKSGDCIHVKFGYSNIIIDTGFFATAKETLYRIFEECKVASEKVNLIVITHTDQDHISGMKGLDGKKEYFKLLDGVWINTPGSLKQYNPSSEISFIQGEKIRGMLEENNIPFKSELHNSLDEFYFRGAKFLILSPTKSDLDKYNDQWHVTEGAMDIASNKSDWDLPICELIEKDTPLDQSNSNKVSIAFILSHGNSNALFLGDANSNVITEKLINCGYSREKPLKLECLKLSHHGSSCNISQDLINLIDCQNYMISSNSSHLDKLTLAKIINLSKNKHNRNIHFYFNYPKEVYHGLITQDEIENYGIKCHFAEAPQNYIELLLEE